MTVNDYLIQLQKLTQKNLDILSAINETFMSDKSKISVNIDGNLYTLPSIIYLENKINSLTDNFKNLINAPATGEAYFNMDGNSRAIEVRGYTCTPNSLELNTPEEFSSKPNYVFKDFLTPTPYVKFDLSTIPNDLTEVNVKKVIPHNPELVNWFKNELLNDDGSFKKSCSVKWSDVYKKLYSYTSNTDYTEYDSIYKLPIRKNIGTGTYVIEKIVKDIVDENLDNYITLKLRSNLTSDLYENNLSYKLFDNTISKPLAVGDELITYDDTAKMVITDIVTSTNTITIKVLNGEYLNLIECPTENDIINDLSKIRFYSPVDFDKDKYIDIPLEEDQYVFVAIAPLNDRMNIQSGWGIGVIIDSYSLLNSDGVTFKEYYDNNVKNLGDILYELTSIMSRSTISKMDSFTFDSLVNAVPIISQNNLKVVQINNHLNDSKSISNIKQLYNQKKKLEIELNEVQANIDSVNEKLSSISFDDTTNLRSAYTSQLTEYNKKKNNIVTSLTKTINAISLEAANSDVPIEAAKYHIRGYFDVEEFANKVGVAPDHIKGIRVQYRYKNPAAINSKAYSITDKFLYSDWNVMVGFDNHLLASNNNGIKFTPQGSTNIENVPSFNQIDIPITQGEVVDIKLRILYDYGYPLAEMYSGWSDIISVSFPDEFTKDIQVTTILEENNNDIETNRFNDIINEMGIPDHINDKIMDQDITYFHKPENISSGFYTEERRIIPLKDKLLELDTDLTALKDEVYGTQSDSLTVTVSNGDAENTIFPFQDNNITVESYSSFVNNEDNDLIKNGVYSYNTVTGAVSTIMNIIIQNQSKHTIKLFSIFPGSKNIIINKLTNYKFNKQDYCDGDNKGVYMFLNTTNSGFKLQSANQYITFRINNPYDGTLYYADPANNNQMTSNVPTNINESDNNISNIYPTLRNEFDLCMDGNNQYISLAQNEKLIIPIYFEYKLKGDSAATEKTISFDLRTSLYSDPTNYTFTVNAKYINTNLDTLLITNNRRNNLNTKYYTTIK